MDETIYQVKTEKFEGPLDVLLSLVEKRKLHISDISLAEVTDEYVDYVKDHIGQDLPNVTLFLSIAATLVLLKSKMLLDGSSIEDEEVNSAKNNLEERLRLLEMLRNGSNSYLNSKPSPYLEFLKRKNINTVSFIPHADVNIENLLNIANEVINKLPKEKEKLPKIQILRVMTLEEMIGKITNNLKSLKQSTSFNSLAQSVHFKDMTPKEIKVSVIVSFLAVLELVRGGLMDAEQTSNYGDIICEPINTNLN